MAATAPSNSNTQPWHVHVLTGDAKTRLGKAIVHELETNGRAVDTEYPYQPAEWQEPFLSRRRSFGQSLYLEQLGIDPADAAGRHAHHVRNYDFFGAPVGLILTVSRHSLAGALIDAGLFLQGLATAARAHGLDTCMQASFIDSTRSSVGTSAFRRTVSPSAACRWVTPTATTASRSCGPSGSRFRPSSPFTAPNSDRSTSPWIIASN